MGGRFARTAYGAAEDIATSDITHIDYDNVLWQMVLAQTVDQHAHPVNRYENSQEANVLIGIATYLIVAFLHARHVKKVPLSLALKVTE